MFSDFPPIKRYKRFQQIITVLKLLTFSEVPVIQNLVRCDTIGANTFIVIYVVKKGGLRNNFLSFRGLRHWVSGKREARIVWLRAGAGGWVDEVGGGGWTTQVGRLARPKCHQ